MLLCILNFFLKTLTIILSSGFPYFSVFFETRCTLSEMSCENITSATLSPKINYMRPSKQFSYSIVRLLSCVISASRSLAVRDGGWRHHFRLIGLPLSNKIRLAYHTKNERRLTLAIQECYSSMFLKMT